MLHKKKYFENQYVVTIRFTIFLTKSIIFLCNDFTMNLIYIRSCYQVLHDANFTFLSQYTYSDVLIKKELPLVGPPTGLFLLSWL